MKDKLLGAAAIIVGSMLLVSCSALGSAIERRIYIHCLDKEYEKHARET